jgi:hypothetical protein
MVRVVVEEPLQEPLLPHQGGGGEGAGEAAAAPRGGTCSTAGGVSNLVTTAVGAGMVALPRAVSETGILLGLLLFFGTAALTLCSTSIIVRYASRYNTKSYGDLVRLHFGRGGAALLQAAIVIHVGEATACLLLRKLLCSCVMVAGCRLQRFIHVDQCAARFPLQHRIAVSGWLLGSQSCHALLPQLACLCPSCLPTQPRACLRRGM